jgi:hypothetical protein
MSAAASGTIAWTRVRSTRTLSSAAKSLYVVGSVLSASWIVWGAIWVGSLGASMTILAWPLLMVSYAVRLSPSHGPGALSVAGDALFVHQRSGARKILRDDIVSALLVPRAMGQGTVAAVELDLVGGDRVTLRTPDAAAAEAVVRELGFGPGGKRIEVDVAGASRRLMHPVLALGSYIVITLMITAFATLGAAWNELALPLLLQGATPALTMLLYELAKRASGAPRVSVGVDGVIVTRGLRREHFPLDAERALPREGAFLDRERCAAVAAVIDARREAIAVSPERRVRYARQDRPVTEWRSAIARAVDEPGYRVAPAPVDEAEATLRSATAAPDERVGAALAMRVRGEGGERIRVAAAAMSDERLRLALEAVADAEDDAALDQALAKLG